MMVKIVVMILEVAEISIANESDEDNADDDSGRSDNRNDDEVGVSNELLKMKDTLVRVMHMMMVG